MGLHSPVNYEDAMAKFLKDFEELKETITRLEQEAVVILEKMILAYWESADNEIAIRKQQEDYNSLVVLHIRLLDLKRTEVK